MISEELVRRVRAGDRRALARAITQVEKEPVGLDKDGSTPVIGVTGPPGVGKSTLVNSLVTEMRSRHLSVAVVAVDPSSPITGGALLGDRIRMQSHIDDDQVYIRSMASRGQLGGLSRATADAVALLETAGFDLILIETVGVGQSEVEVMNLSDVVVLVLAPGWGDQIQADKAGIAEIADVFVINKVDRAGADDLARFLSDSEKDRPKPRPVYETEATSGKGVGALADWLKDRR